MDGFVERFMNPVGAWGGKGLDDRTPPDLEQDYAARLLAVVVEILGGQVTVTRSQLQSAPDQLLLLVWEGEDRLEFQTRHLESTGRPSDIPER